MQIKNKLTIQFVFLVAALMLSAFVFIFYTFKNLTVDEFYNSLRTKALMTAEMVLKGEDKLTPLVQSNEKDNQILPFKENITIYNQRFDKVFSFNPYATITDIAFLRNLRKDKEKRYAKGEYHMLGFTHKTLKGNEYFILAESQFDSHDLEKLSTILILTYLASLFVLFIVGRLFAGQALFPISKIITSANEIRPSDLSARIKPTNTNDELQWLANTINKLLDRIEKAFVMQKNFISNVSHELKNPLAAITSQLDVSLTNKSRNAEDYIQTLSSVLEDVYDITNTSETLLQLARINSLNSNIQFERLKIDDLILSVRNKLLRQHKEFNIGINIEGELEDENYFYTSGNSALLKSAFLNLIENGCKYSDDHTVHIILIIAKQGDHIVKIIDEGKGMSEIEIKNIFATFYRIEETKHVSGSGIGLSLVDSVVKLHDIDLKIKSELGSGTCFTLKFPILPQVNEAI
jgi:signal transduction histidine kinase